MTTTYEGSADLALRDEKPVRYALAPPSFAMPRSIADIQVLGQMMIESGFFKDVRSVSQACVKIIAGAALGYDPFTSMNAFHIIEGKVTPTASEIAARIKRSGRYNFRIERLDEKGCSLVFFEREDGATVPIGKSEFMEADAKAAGLAGKDVWRKYARNMYFARALTNGARWYCADVFGGPVYTAEELGAEVAMGSDGEMRVVDPSPLASEQQTASKPVLATDEQTRAFKAACTAAGIASPAAWIVANVAPDFASRAKKVLTAEEHERAMGLLEDEIADQAAQKATEVAHYANAEALKADLADVPPVESTMILASAPQKADDAVRADMLLAKKRALRLFVVTTSAKLWPTKADADKHRHAAMRLHRIVSLNDEHLADVSLDALQRLADDLERRLNGAQRPGKPEGATDLLAYAGEKIK